VTRVAVGAIIVLAVVVVVVAAVVVAAAEGVERVHAFSWPLPASVVDSQAPTQFIFAMAR
jgi:hypothetical protein